MTDKPAATPRAPQTPALLQPKPAQPTMHVTNTKPVKSPLAKGVK